MVRGSEKRFRVMATVGCLLAVAMMYAPMMAAAWPGLGAACCNDKMCELPHHHHGHGAAQKPEAAMDCGYDMTGMSACTMSCCHETERAVMTPTAFVLPSGIVILAPERPSAAESKTNSIEIPRPYEPQSPPPRSA